MPLRKQNFIRKMYGVGQEEMKKMLQVSEKRGGLHGKLKDLNTLYMGFTKYIQDKYIILLFHNLNYLK